SMVPASGCGPTTLAPTATAARAPVAQSTRGWNVIVKGGFQVGDPPTAGAVSVVNTGLSCLSISVAFTIVSLPMPSFPETRGQTTAMSSPGTTLGLDGPVSAPWGVSWLTSWSLAAGH